MMIFHHLLLRMMVAGVVVVMMVEQKTARRKHEFGGSILNQITADKSSSIWRLLKVVDTFLFSLSLSFSADNEDELSACIRESGGIAIMDASPEINSNVQDMVTTYLESAHALPLQLPARPISQCTVRRINLMPYVHMYVSFMEGSNRNGCRMCDAPMSHHLISSLSTSVLTRIPYRQRVTKLVETSRCVTDTTRPARTGSTQRRIGLHTVQR